MGYIDKNGAYYEGDRVPGDRLASAEEQQARDLIAAKAQLAAAVQEHLDSSARSRGYDDIKSAVTYAEEPAVGQFQAEGRALRAWRSRVWEHCYSVSALVEAGNRSMPTGAELIAELPVLNLP